MLKVWILLNLPMLKPQGYHSVLINLPMLIVNQVRNKRLIWESESLTLALFLRTGEASMHHRLSVLHYGISLFRLLCVFFHQLKTIYLPIL
jgi:hypothetical protein